MLNKFCFDNSLSPAVDISEDLVQSYSILCILDETVINIAELNTKVHIIFARKKIINQCANLRVFTERIFLSFQKNAYLGRPANYDNTR